MPNHLAAAQSPYLLQHQDNPVDWYPWGEEAFAEARRRDVPLLISVGYAACHWCHVMAHESFEDPATATVMNRWFVNVKVDREEHPDVDAVYMSATQATTGQGGWPMTVFAAPDGSPFFCGTYFPARPVAGMPSFRQLLDAVHDAWERDREGVLRSAQALGDALAEAARRAGAPHGPAPEEGLVRAALDRAAADEDRVYGGFGGPPKFPPSTTLAWLLRHHARTGEPRALELVERTCEAMARGGTYDQLAGGFARYSVDAAWAVPHFEKMLYDNAQLLGVYADVYRLTGSAFARRVAHETGAWLLTELRTAQGALASSLDADSAGVEGAFYVWTPGELVGVLGETDARWAADVWDVSPPGSFERGTSVLQLRHDPDDAERYARVRRTVRAARAYRPQPARDDKVVVAWNAMAARELARAAELLEEPAWLEAAEEIVAAVLAVHPTAVGRLVRTSRQGRPGPSAAALEDYAHLAEALLTLYQLTGRRVHVEEAARLLDVILEQFVTEQAVFDTARADTDPAVARLGRPAEVADGATPSGTAAAAGAFLSYAALTGSHRHREAAARCLAGPLGLAADHPRAVSAALAVAEAWLDGPQQVAVVGPADDVRTAALRQVAVRATAPGLVLAVGTPGEAPVPLLAGRGLVRGEPAAYVCRDLTCRLPTTDPEQLAAQLGR